MTKLDSPTNAPAATQPKRITLSSLPRGTRLLFGGDQLLEVPDAVADRFVPGDALVIAEATHEQQHFYETVNAPFVSDGPTRWVDGQKALQKPELGLSNWQFGRLFGRGGILSGDGVLTVRTRATRIKPR